LSWFDLAKAVKGRGHDLEAILYKLASIDPDEIE
jgi:hypothetical protein